MMDTQVDLSLIHILCGRSERSYPACLLLTQWPSLVSFALYVWPVSYTHLNLLSQSRTELSPNWTVTTVPAATSVPAGRDWVMA